MREIIKNSDIRHNFFKNRIVKGWNKLSNEIKKAKSVYGFKILFDMLSSGCYSAPSTVGGLHS